MRWAARLFRGVLLRARAPLCNCVCCTTPTMKWPRLELDCCVTKTETDRERERMFILTTLLRYFVLLSIYFSLLKVFYSLQVFLSKCVFHFPGITLINARSLGYILLLDNTWEVRYLKLTTAELSVYWNYYLLLLLLLLLTANELSLGGSFFFAVALRRYAGHGLHILDVSRSHTTTHGSR